MYLQKAWRYNKLFFFLVVFFILGQAFVTINRGMLFSPFFNYSMYASSFWQKDTLLIVEMYSAGKPLQPTEVSTRDWDKLTIAYSYSANLRRNDWVVSEIQRLTHNAGLTWPTECYQNRLDSTELEKRWRSLFFDVTGRKVDSVKSILYQKQGVGWNRN